MVTKMAAIAAVVVVGLVGAALVGYTFVLPASKSSSTNTTHVAHVTSTAAASSSAAALEITSSSLSGTSLSVTVENLGSQPASLDSLLVSPENCTLTTRTFTSFTSFTSFNSTSFTPPAGANQTRPAVFANSCPGGLSFLVRTNSTLTPISAAAFNFTSFNSTSFTRTFTGNFTGTFTGNFTRTFSGNFTGIPPGNFTGISPGNFTGAFGINGTGFQLAAGQTVTFTYNGSSVSNLAAGQYTIMVAGQDAEAEITIVVG